ncbi:MAG: hypothetical protein HOP32_06970 [Nitrospira sp.]|nr:hypothetical protein [Nitrospira sp.]
MAENRELALVLKLVADNFNSELKKSGGMLGEFNRFISDWKTQLVAAGGALFVIAKSTANYGEELLKTSQKVGVSVQALAGLQHAANLADLSQEQLAQGLKFLSVNMVEAARRSGDGEALFRRLGVAATDTTGKLRPTEQVLLDVADAFAKSKDGASKAEVAVKLFGKAGLDLIPFLNQGKAGIQELMAEAQKFGLVMSRENAEAANRFNDELKTLTAQLRGMTFAVGKELIPVMTEFMRVMSELGGGSIASGVGTFMKATVFGFEDLALSIGLAGKQLALLGANFTDIFNPEKARTLGAQMDALAAAKDKQSIEAAGRISGVVPLVESGRPSVPQRELGQEADQEKLAKSLVEIWEAGNRALEIRNKLTRESAEGLSVEFLAFDRREQFRKEDEARQVQLGQMIVEQTGLEVRVRDAALAKERQGLVDNAQAWLTYHAQLGGSTALRYQKEVELTQATLAKQLDLTQEEAAQLLEAWSTHESEKAELILSKTALTAQERETIELQSLTRLAQANERASDDVFAGWAKGMHNYVTQTGNGFNLATDMARSTAQAMEQGFRNFFFDVMDNKIKSFKDVLASLLDFAKRIMAQVAASLATNAILNLVASAFSGGTGKGATAGAGGSAIIGKALGGQGGLRRFAQGGNFIVPGSGGTDSELVRFMATPGEQVSVRTPSQQRQSSAINIAITVNATGGARRESGTGAAPNFSQLARDLSRLVESKIIEEQRPGGLLAGATA